MMLYKKAIGELSSEQHQQIREARVERLAEKKLAKVCIFCSFGCIDFWSHKLCIRFLFFYFIFFITYFLKK